MALDYNTATRTAPLALAMIVAVGCGGTGQSQPSSTASELVRTVSGESGSRTKQSPGSSASDINQRAARQARDAAQFPADPAKTAYVGPFAHRTNPFALPNADHVATAAKTRASEKTSQERLLGFVDVDGRKALLQVDGKVWAAREGERQGDVEVVEIAPAHVTLRRNGTIWNVSLMPRDRSS